MSGSDQAESRRVRPAAAAAVTVAVLSAGALVATVVLGATADVTLADFRGQWIWWPSAFVFAATGTLVTLRRPRHPIGWVFALTGLSVAVTFVLQVTGTGHLEGDARAWVITIGDVQNAFTVPLLVFLAGALFPDGNLPSRRWRLAAALAVVVAALGAVTTLLAGGWGGDPAQAIVPSPLAERYGEVGMALSPVFFALLTLLLVLSASALIIRFRRSQGNERQQMKLLVLALVLMFVSVLVGFALDAVGARVGDVSISGLLTAIAMTFIPVSVTVAVLRHGLFEIDIVISRAATYGVLAGVITAVYVGIVVGVGSGLGFGDEPNLVLSIAATAVVAVAFEPMRSRVTQWVNRLVFGRRVTPYEVMAALTTRLSEVTSSDEALSRLAQLVADGTGASRAAVWLRVGDELRRVATSPAPSQQADVPVPVVDERLPDLPGAVVAPVVHGAELLGAITVDKPRNDSVTPADDRLVSDAAAGASLLLRNLRLNAELEERAAELRASQRRLVASHDDARRRLERDLHDGAQQEVVALKVKLGLARTLADREGATELIDDIARLAETSQQTVETMRTIARGIYPPLLEAEGLVAAITAAANQSPIAVSVQATDVARYPREVEATVYFTVLEALRALPPGIEGAAVELTEGAVLEVSVAVHHPGVGPLDLSTDGLVHAADRVAALDGEFLDVPSTARSTLTIRLPATPAVPA